VIRGAAHREAFMGVGEQNAERDPLLLRLDRGSLRLDAPRSTRVPRYMTWDDHVGAWRTEALRYSLVREDAAAYHFTLDDQAPRFFDCPTLHPALPRLRPDQQAAVEAWERAGYRGVVVKPTGTGKTGIALTIIARHRVSALIVVPLRDLMYQWQRRIRQGLGVEAGILGDGRREVWPNLSSEEVINIEIRLRLTDTLRAQRRRRRIR
jgi:Xeroderma pigmentosum group B helicase damage recognition domain/Type III restriction enzyme, res subunit